MAASASASASASAALQLALTCFICRAPFTSACVLTGCGHAFCSLCVREWLLRSPACPQCARARHLTDLVPCPALQAAVEAWQQQQTQRTQQSPQVKQPAGKSAAPKSHLPHLHYDSLSDDKLDEVLRKHNLPVRLSSSSSSREAKILLHTKFTCLYNARVDNALNPDFCEEDVAKEAVAAHQATFSASASSSLASSSSSLSHWLGAGRTTAAAAPTTSATPGISNWKELKRRARLHARKHERKHWKGRVVSRKWRAVFSDPLNRAVYYNTETKECTLEKPAEMILAEDDFDRQSLATEIEGDAEGAPSPVKTKRKRSEDDSAVVVVVVDSQ